MEGRKEGRQKGGTRMEGRKEQDRRIKIEGKKPRRKL